MSVIILLIGVSLFVALIFLYAFVWCVKSGQYEDKYTPSVRMLFDDESSNNVEIFHKDIKKNNKL